MSQLLPDSTTVGDLINAAMTECGAIGVGQMPTQQDTSNAWARLQWMLQEWERKRWLVYQLVTLLLPSTGLQSYSVGPGGYYDTGAGSARPDKIEAAFLRQYQGGGVNPVDYPLELLISMEDYSRLTLKTLSSWTQCVFYDPGWPLGALYPWPIPTANIYGVGIVVKQQLPTKFATLATQISLPYEYYNAIVMNLAIRLRSMFSIGTYPGDPLPGLAKDSLNALRGANTKISRLTMPEQLTRPGLYNIFSDRSY